VNTTTTKAARLRARLEDAGITENAEVFAPKIEIGKRTQRPDDLPVLARTGAAIEWLALEA
jgi:hypothetical protein